MAACDCQCARDTTPLSLHSPSTIDLAAQNNAKSQKGFNANKHVWQPNEYVRIAEY